MKADPHFSHHHIGHLIQHLNADGRRERVCQRFRLPLSGQSSLLTGNLIYQANQSFEPLIKAKTA